MWCFDDSRHLLTRDGTVHRLEPKAVAVLARLVETPGVVVSKEELLDSAWPGQYVSDEVLTNAVYQIRKALGDDARRPRYIETIPKAGYRLLEPPQPLSRSAALADDESSGPPPIDPTPPGTLAARRPDRPARRAVAAAGLAALLLAGIGVLLTGGQNEPPGVAASALIERGWTVLESARAGAANEAAALAREAVALDREDPDGWALSAAAWAERAAAASFPEAERSYSTALEAARRALEIDPSHPRALAARARARWLGSWDWDGAETDLRTALSSTPDSAPLWADYAELQLFSGRIDSARQHLERALDLDPTSSRIRITAALAASLGGDAEAAARHYRDVLKHHPGHDTARRLLTKLRGRPTVRETGDRIEALAGKDRIRPGHVALWFLESDDHSAALSWLDRAIAEHDPTVLFFRFDPRWDRLRDHPRYRAAMSRAGIAARS